MGIVAGFLVQNALKYLLKFGTVTPFLGYNALDDFFPNYTMKPNPDCDDSFCLKRQKEHFERRKDAVAIQSEDVAVPISHEDNLWQISVVDESPIEAYPSSTNVATGLRLAYEAPNKTTNNETSIGGTEDNVADLMQQLLSLGKS